MVTNSIAIKGMFWQTRRVGSVLSIRKLPLELVLEGFDFLLLLQFLFGEGLAGRELVVFKRDGEERPAFPAAVWALIIGLNQRQAAVGLACGAFDFY